MRMWRRECIRSGPTRQYPLLVPPPSTATARREGKGDKDFAFFCPKVKSLFRLFGHSNPALIGWPDDVPFQYEVVRQDNVCTAVELGGGDKERWREGVPREIQAVV